MWMELYNVKKYLAQPWSCHDLDKTKRYPSISFNYCVFDTTRSKSKSRSLLKRKTSPFGTRNLRNCVYHKGT